jgi:hypothetical protein
MNPMNIFHKSDDVNNTLPRNDSLTLGAVLDSQPRLEFNNESFAITNQ